MRLAVFLGALLAGWLLASAVGNSAPVPCSDPRGCPDLHAVVPNKDMQTGLFTFAPTDCTVQEGEVQAGTRKLLRFTSQTSNTGPGSLIIGNPGDHPEWFTFAPCHGHYHFVDYAAYRFWTQAGYATWKALRLASPNATPGEVLAAHPELTGQFVAGHKQGFCIIDVTRAGGPADQYPNARGGFFPIFNSCGDQGLSVGWADEYWWGLDGQWIDITDLPTGTYMLEVEVNPSRLFIETDYSFTSNSDVLKVTLR